MAEETSRATQTHSRREPRFAVNDLVRVSTGKAPNQQILEGQISDLSKSGLAAFVREAVPAGTPVEVDLNDTTVFGDVRYCELMQDGYRIGIEIDSVQFRDLTVGPQRVPRREPDTVWSALRKLYRALTTGA